MLEPRRPNQAEALVAATPRNVIKTGGADAQDHHHVGKYCADVDKTHTNTRI